MLRVLVTGMSEPGKSSPLAELADRGHRVGDTDDGIAAKPARVEEDGAS